jgi:hypothetical protein
MASTSIPGRFAKLRLSADGGTTYENLGGIIDLTLNINVDELETTTHDSNGVRSFIPNHSDFTLEASGRWEDGDPGQGMALDAIDAKQTLQFIFTMETRHGAKQWEGSCFGTNASPAGPLDDTAGMDLSFRCSGVSRTVQVIP